MNDACVVGYGVVGKATAVVFGIEKYYSRSESNVTLEEVAQCKYIFICLPTPTVEGACYTDDIFKIISDIHILSSIENIFIIRSTVYPGFNKFLQRTLNITAIVSNPEFLSEDTAINDAAHPDLVVLGGEDTHL